MQPISTIPMECGINQLGESNVGKILNFGCGTRPHVRCVNVDLESRPGIICHDLRDPLPFQSHHFDGAYSSHVLEHFTPTQAHALLRELNRVLRPGGIVRIVVPDLEEICREYLKNLESVTADSTRNRQLQYEWSVMELFDQMVRDVSGGEMLKALLDGNIDADYVRKRNGTEFDDIIRAGVRSRETVVPVSTTSGSITQAVGPKRSLIRRGIGRVRQLISARRKHKRAPIASTTDPRQSGESHRWMYDRHSLAMRLKDCGFVDVRFLAFDESQIEGWDSLQLDAIAGDMRPWKPNSIYCEAIKPCSK